MLTKKNHKFQGVERPRADYQVVCSWCGTVIRSNADATEDQMCLICHARMLNDYFQKVKRVSDERRASRRF